jgi:glycosyltransferase involved in cell wall biosynthesis
LKVSLIIPCIPLHAPYLSSLLKTYEMQTVLPDEVVISLSEADLVESKILKELQTQPWHFPILLVLSKEKLYAGENRNKACEHATGDIFVCQDADDIPHPQRLEIIKYFFEHYPVDHLVHEFVFVTLSAHSIPSYTMHSDFSKIPFFYNEEISHAWKNGEPLSPGNPAIRRAVFEKIKWSNMPRQQDLIFNEAVYEQFKHCYALKIPLLLYRQFLSSLNTDVHKRHRTRIVTQDKIFLKKLSVDKQKKHTLTIIRYN